MPTRAALIGLPRGDPEGGGVTADRDLPQSSSDRRWGRWRWLDRIRGLPARAKGPPLPSGSSGTHGGPLAGRLSAGCTAEIAAQSLLR